MKIKIFLFNLIVQMDIIQKWDYFQILLLKILLLIFFMEHYQLVYGLYFDIL